MREFAASQLASAAMVNPQEEVLQDATGTPALTSVGQ